MPYPLRSPRTKQQRMSSPVHFVPSSSGKHLHGHISYLFSSFLLEVHSSLISNSNEYHQMPTITSSIESSQIQRIQIISQTPHYSSPTSGQTTMPIQIPTPSNTGLPTTSLSQLTNLFPTQSQSLPTYFLPTANIAYISTANPSNTPFDFPSLPPNTSMVFITNPNQHPSQPLHILTPIDHRSLQFAHYIPTNTFPHPPPAPTAIPMPIPFRTSNILESMSILQNKRHENEEDKQIQQQQAETTKQSAEQLPFKKRRYTDQQLRMATVHDDDDESI